MILETDTLCYQIDGKPLIHGISLEFQSGKIYGVLGPNGAGKSTLLKLIAGVWTPSAGAVRWNGTDLLLKTRREHSCIISLVPHSPSLHFDFTVREIVAMGRYAASNRESSRAIDAALERTDLCGLVNRPLTQLSSGERQRVYLARSLATESPVLLLDEPTTNLDVSHRLDIWNILRALREEGKIIVTALHNLAAAERLCDEVVILNKGRCEGRGHCSDILTPKILQDVFGVSSLMPLECD